MDRSKPFLVKGNCVAPSALAVIESPQPLYRYGLGCTTAVFALALVGACRISAQFGRLVELFKGRTRTPAGPMPVQRACTLVTPVNTGLRYSR